MEYNLRVFAELNNPVIVCYPGGAGGKFLINSLGLSRSAVFQDINLANAQLAGNLTSQDKFNYLINELNNVTTYWNDLNLGCGYITGINPQQFIEKNLYLFLVAHNSQIMDQRISQWPNAKFIVFKNATEFILSRKNTYFFKDVTVPNNSKTDIELIQRSIILRTKRLNNVIWWDTNWYFSESNTLDNIENVYVELGLSDFNREFVKEYYNQWINKLEELKINNIKN